VLIYHIIQKPLFKKQVIKAYALHNNKTTITIIDTIPYNLKILCEKMTEANKK